MNPTARRLGEALLTGGSQHSWAPDALPGASIPRYRRTWRCPSWLRAAASFAAVAVVGSFVLVGGFLASIVGGRRMVALYLGALAVVCVAVWAVERWRSR